MRDEQYRQLLENRARRPLTPLFHGGAGTRAVRLAARSAQRRERAGKALAELLPPEWVALTHVEALEHGTLFVRVANAAIRERLRREAAPLAHCVPGVSRIRVT